MAGALKQCCVAASEVDEVLLGNVLNAGLGQAPSRQAALGAGIPESVPCTDVNKVCASGMKTVMLGAQSVMLGHADVVVAGGFESMSNVPMYLPKKLPSYGHAAATDGILRDGLWDVYNDFHMGNCGEKCAKDHGVGREEQDAFALESYARASAAQEAGVFGDEIVPVTVTVRGKETVVDTDEEPGKLRADKLKTLSSAFMKDGTITAANASKLNDGAAAVVLMAAEAAQARGLPPLAKIRGFADAAQAPVDFSTAPALAVPIALERAGVAAEDVALHEINEAFSVVTIANAKLLGANMADVNIRGGAVALGHPIGASGCRIIVSLVHALKAERGEGAIGVASICNGGGGASAIVIESA